MAKFVIGIDIGTGSAKALAVDLRGDVIRSASVHYPTLQPAPGYCEQAPELIWQAFVKCMQRLSAELQSPSAIILSSAMHSVIPVDHNGVALSNMITWADNRSSMIAERIRQSASGEMLYEQTGTPIHAMSPLCKLIWLREHEPALYRAAHKFISIKEYIWFRLFGEFETDLSLASATGLMDLEKNEWNGNALDLAGLSPEKLSRLVAPDYSRNDCSPTVSAMLGIGPTTRFIIGASDGCLANVGSFATDEGIAALTIGTSGAVRVASRKPVPHFESMTFNYRLDANTFICGGPINNGGAALKWYVQNFLGLPLENAADYEAVLQSLSKTAPGADNLVFLPYLFGERAPIWNSKACGQFFGIRSHHTRDHFTRAVIEGISMSLFDVGSRMTQAGLRIDQIHVSGGFVRSQEWLQILSNIFGKKICLIHADDASALGAAYLGLRTIGAIEALHDLKPDVVAETYPRSPAVERYQDLFSRYRSLYQQTQSLMV